MNDLTNTATIGDNGLENLFDKLLADVRALGRNSAKGADAKAMLAARVVVAAADGVISVGTNRGKNAAPDDIDRIYAAYCKEEATKQVHEMSEGGQAANASKLRQVARFGAMPNLDTKRIFGDWHQQRLDMKGEGVEVKSAFPAYVDLCRAQLKSEVELTPEEAAAVIAKAEPSTPTVAKRLAQAKKILDNLIEGKDGVQCNDPVLVTVTSDLERLMNLEERNAKVAKLLAEAEELGVTINQ